MVKWCMIHNGIGWRHDPTEKGRSVAPYPTGITTGFPDTEGIMSARIKRCNQCSNEFPATLEYFHKDSHKPDGLATFCKPCKRLANRGGKPLLPRLPEPRPGYKFCTICKEEKPATREYFSPGQRMKSGLRSQCKSCVAQETMEKRRLDWDAYLEREREQRRKNRDKINRRNRERAAQNRDAINAKARKRYHDNRERELKRAKDWQAANPEKVKQSKKKYIAANPDKPVEWSRNRRKNNPMGVRADKVRRRARKANAEGSHTAEDRKRIIETQKNRCYYCGKKMDKDATIDHVIPLSRGGSNSPENLVAACKSCNSTKGAKLPHEWPEGGKLL